MAQGVTARRAHHNHPRSDVVTAAVVAEGLTHRFGSLTALDGVDLEVAAGEIYGFLGRNGAGKTTLIRALLGLLAPTSGTVSVLGERVRGGATPSEVWSRVGYLVEGPGLYPSLTVADHLGLAARYRHLNPAAAAAVVDRLDLGRYRGVRARDLSLGNRQRLGLALALIHRPELLVLDEPVNGLDPAGVVDVRALLRTLADDGATVFMSTHLITEVARLADRVGIIHRGRLVEQLSGERLQGGAGQRLVCTFRTPALAQQALSVLHRRGLDARCDDGSPVSTALVSTALVSTALVSTAEQALRCPDQVAAHLVEAGAPPMSLLVEHEDLEQYFLRLTGEDR